MWSTNNFHSHTTNIDTKKLFVTILHFLKRLFISTYLSLHDESNGEGNIRRFGCCCSNMFLYSSSCHFCCYYFCCFCLPSSWYYFCFCCVCQITREGTEEKYFFSKKFSNWQLLLFYACPMTKLLTLSWWKFYDVIDVLFILLYVCMFLEENHKRFCWRVRIYVFKIKMVDTDLGSIPDGELIFSLPFSNK